MHVTGRAEVLVQDYPDGNTVAQLHVAIPRDAGFDDDHRIITEATAALAAATGKTIAALGAALGIPEQPTPQAAPAVNERIFVNRADLLELAGLVIAHLDPDRPITPQVQHAMEQAVDAWLREGTDDAGTER